VFLEQAGEVILPWLDKLGTRHLCAAGGSFLNVKMNQNIWYSGKLDTQWIYPNPGDAGLAVGAALNCYYGDMPNKRHELLDNAILGRNSKMMKSSRYSTPAGLRMSISRIHPWRPPNALQITVSLAGSRGGWNLARER
ncbi:MAG TPA: hypothetical protein ENH05_04150, partial [Rhizobiales bacterium]|nr:hypothetical protein [Hyphomicrobiales bacterium]